jgi:predicted rRNA methylase YqxC with S4 and FtsJ domains
MTSNFEVVAVIDSPIVGGDGNKEFLLFARKK